MLCRIMLPLGLTILLKKGTTVPKAKLSQGSLGRKMNSRVKVPVVPSWFLSVWFSWQVVPHVLSRYSKQWQYTFRVPEIK